MGCDIYDSAGDHLFGRTLKDRDELGSNSIRIIPGRTYKLQMRCNDGNPFNREKCRGRVFWQCLDANGREVSCGTAG